MEEDGHGFLEAAPLLRLQPFQCHHQSHHYNIVINLSDIVNIWLTLTKMMTEHVFQVWPILVNIVIIINVCLVIQHHGY